MIRRVSNAAPPVLTEPGSLPAEPLFIDVSADAPWDYRAPVFREKVTALAAPIHGKPKDQLASDDLREQRRFRRLRAAAIAGLAVLTVVAVVAAIVAVAQRQEAIRQRNPAIAQRLDAEAQSMLAGVSRAAISGPSRNCWPRGRWPHARQRRAAACRWPCGPTPSRSSTPAAEIERRGVQPRRAADSHRGARPYGAAVGRRHRPTDRRAPDRAHR